MAYTLYKDITTVNRTVLSNKVNKYVVLHFTGNKTDTAKNNANYFKSVNRNASAHYFVDKTTVYQVVEDKDASWAIGVNYGSNNLFGIVTNNNSINIEMCSDNGVIADETFNNTVELTKFLMKKYCIPASNVYRHFDVCSKLCPGWAGWVGSNVTLWNKFKSSITTTSTTSTSTTTSELYRVRKSWADSSSQIGAYSSLENAKAACKDGYAVFDSSGNQVYSNTSNSSQVTPTTSKSILNSDVTYRVYANGKWYPEVKNLSDYAGDGKNPIQGIAIKVSTGSIKYRVHCKNKNWYPYVTGYSITDHNNGYAGDVKNDIDGVEIIFITPSGYIAKRAKYRMSPIGGNYYSWQYDNEKTNGQDGYAGLFGKSFGKFQMIIE